MYTPILQTIFKPFTGDFRSGIDRDVLTDIQKDKVLFKLDFIYGENLRDYPVKVIGVDIESFSKLTYNFRVVFNYGGKFYVTPFLPESILGCLGKVYLDNRANQNIPNFPIALYHHLMGLTDEDRVIYKHHYQTSNLSVIITNTFHCDNYLKQMRIGKYLILDHDKESVVFHSYDCLIGTTYSAEDYDRVVKIRESMLAAVNA